MISRLQKIYPAVADQIDDPMFQSVSRDHAPGNRQNSLTYFQVNLFPQCFRIFAKCR